MSNLSELAPLNRTGSAADGGAHMALTECKDMLDWPTKFANFCVKLIKNRAA